MWNFVRRQNTPGTQCTKHNMEHKMVQAGNITPMNMEREYPRQKGLGQAG